MKKTLLSRLVAAATLTFAAICANTATADDGVTKSRLGSLRRDDMVVVDVKGSVNTNAVRELMAEYDRSVIKPREDGISVDLSGRTVVSVNGKTGSVSLVVADIPGAASTDDVASAISGIDMSGYLRAADVPEWAKEVAKPTYSANEIAGLDTALAGKQGTIDTEGVLFGTGSGGVRAATKEDITRLGIPAQDTTYSEAVAPSNGVGGASGLMSAADKGKIDSLPALGGAATLDVGTEAGTVAAGNHTHSQYLGVNDVHEWAKQETPPSDGDPVFMAWKASTKIETKVSNLESIAGGLTTKTTGLSDSVEDLSLSLADLYDLALLVDDPVDYLKESPYFTRNNDQLVETIVDVTYSKADSDDMSVTQVTGSTDKVEIQLQPGKSAIVITEHQDISGKQGTIDTEGVLFGTGSGGVRAATKEDITRLGIPAQDTTYSAAVASSNRVGGASGLMTAVDKEKLDGIPALGGAATLDVGTEAGTVAAGNHTHSQYLGVNDVHEWAKGATKPTYSANEITGLDTALEGKQVTITTTGVLVGDGSGGVRAASKADITALDIPAQDTTYTDAVASSNGVGGASGLMTAADKEKIDGLPAFGNSATLDVGTTAGTVAAGNHTHSQYLGVNDVHEWAKAENPPAEQDPTVSESLSRFASTGTVYRADSYGTPTRWTDATGCVWAVYLDDRWVVVGNQGIPDGVQIEWDGPRWLAEDDGMFYTGDGWYVSNGLLTPDRVSTDMNAVEIVFDWHYNSEGEILPVRTVFSRAVLTNVVDRTAFMSEVTPVTVVAPTTNAAPGSAADARVTGAALYGGYTEWEASASGCYVIWDDYGWALCTQDGTVIGMQAGDRDSTDLRWDLLADGFQSVITATRHRITPTKVSQLENDSGFTALSDDQVHVIDSSVSARYTVVVDTYGTTNSLDIVGVLSSNSVPFSSIAVRVSIGTAVTAIGDDAFRGCSSLSSILIPDTVSVIGADAFRDCTSLLYVMLPDSITTIKARAFFGCTAMTRAIIPRSVPQVLGGTFQSCSQLSSVEIPASVNLIAGDAFYGCAKLVSLGIPASVTTLQVDCFRNCPNLSRVTFCGRTLNEVMAMSNYGSWGIDASVIRTDMPLSGKQYDFATNEGLYLAVRDIVEALGGSVTNFPAISQ